MHKTIQIDSIKAPLAFLVIVFCAIFGVYQLQPPKPVSVNAPPEEFSSGRAMRDVETIAASPHPMGSSEQSKVRAFILKRLTDMGLEAQVQEAVGLNLAQGAPFRAGTVQNIVARLPGTNSTKAILLVAHYDSVPNGPGASDDSASVAILLETARALKAALPLKNDAIFLWSDGEEYGALGASAFLQEHPWARNVGLVVNLEARGVGGPSIMFETNAENGWFIREFAKSVPFPVANSLAYEVYRLLPNGTDFTVFREAGFAGFNIAFIKGSVYYHTPLDNIKNIDERSLQHQGSYALALARHFGDLALQDTKESNQTYFDILGLVLVHYPGVWNIPLVVLAGLSFVGVVTLGFRKQRLTFLGIVLGSLVFLACLIVAPALVSLAWQIIRMLHSGYKSFMSETYNSGLYLLSFVTLTIALVSLLYALLRQKIGVEGLTIGALFWWLISAILASLYLPGSSYLFAWPLLLSLIGWGFTLTLKDQGPLSTKRLAILTLCAIPGVILLAPTIYLMLIAMSLDNSGAIMASVVLLMGLLVPHFSAIRNQWLLPITAASVCVVLVLAGSLTSGFDANHPKPNSVFYCLNADTGQATWASTDQEPDKWVSQFIATDAPRSTLPIYYPLSARKFLQSPAPTVPLAAPDITLLGDNTTNDIRTLSVRITLPQRASGAMIYVTGAQVLGATVNGKRIDPGPTQIHAEIERKASWGLWYWFPPQGRIELTWEIKPSSPAEIRVVSQSYGLPDIPGMYYETRPDYMMPVPFPLATDLTLISKTLIQ